jgi:hypothetical protein
VEHCHDALAVGDSVAALALLSTTVIIMESGSVESLREYRSHHLAADIAFTHAVKETRSPVQVKVYGVGAAVLGLISRSAFGLTRTTIGKDPAGEPGEIHHRIEMHEHDGIPAHSH